MKKNLFKQIGAGLMIGLLFCWTYAGLGANVSATLAASGNTNSLVAASAGYITQISCTATAAVAFTFSLYDAPGNYLTNYTSQYTNYVPTVYTNTATYTDILGNTVSNSYYYITNIATTVGSSGKVTNTYRFLGTFSAPASTTITIPYTASFPFIFGLFATNVSGGGSVSVNYQPLK